jgi:hypothetical protein
VAPRRLLLAGLVLIVGLSAAFAAAEDRVDTIARILQLEDSATYDPFLDKVLFDQQQVMADRVRAARAIGHIGDPDGSIALLRALADSSMDAAAVCQALGELWAHTPAKAYEIEAAPVFLVPLLLVADRNPSPKVRAAAFTAIALAWPGEGLDQAQNTLNDIAAKKIGDPENGLLLSLIRVAAGVKPDQNGDNGTPVEHAKRREAIFLYGFTHPDEAVAYQAASFASRKPMLGLDLGAPLKLLLSHASPLVRAQALRALALRKQADPETLAAAQRVLADGKTQEKIAAIEAVAALAPPAQAVVTLKTALAAAGSKGTTSVHQAIFEAFGKLKADGLAEFLWDVSKQDVPYRRLAGLAAAKAGAQARVLELVPTDFANTDDDAAYFIDLLAAADLRHKLNWLAKGDGVPERFARTLALRQKVVLALAYDEQGEPRGQAIKDHPEWWRDRDWVIREAAFASAGATGDPAVIKELIAAIKVAAKERNPEPTLAVLEAMDALLESDAARGEAELVLGEMARTAVGAADLRVRRKAVALLHKLTREIHKKAVFKTETGKSFADYQHLMSSQEVMPLSPSLPASRHEPMTGERRNRPLDGSRSKFRS